ncbi:MAG TPA: cytidine deaminase [Marmoricola sp.]|nr:cytidine deaminase [Marmoricola sp.]HMY09676.1 cytidine deaminase [Marmoricola sp.]
MDAEDNKLVVLAKATRARTGVDEAAAIRDLDGRTYAAAAVSLPSLQLSAIGAAISMAISSGAKGLEAVLLNADSPVTEADLMVVVEFAGRGVPVRRVGSDGVLVEDKLS